VLSKGERRGRVMPDRKSVWSRA